MPTGVDTPINQQEGVERTEALNILQTHTSELFTAFVSATNPNTFLRYRDIEASAVTSQRILLIATKELQDAEGAESVDNRKIVFMKQKIQAFRDDIARNGDYKRYEFTQKNSDGSSFSVGYTEYTSGPHKGNYAQLIRYVEAGGKSPVRIFYTSTDNQSWTVNNRATTANIDVPTINSFDNKVQAFTDVLPRLQTVMHANDPVRDRRSIN